MGYEVMNLTDSGQVLSFVSDTVHNCLLAFHAIML